MDSFLQKAGTLGRHESVGEFSVDWTAADRKLAEFYRQHPGLWFVKFIQGALALGVSSVVVSDSGKTLTIACDTVREPPRLNELIQSSGEVQEHVITAIRATFGAETELEELALVRILKGSEPRRLLFARGAGTREEKVSSELCRELNSNFGAQLYVRLKWGGAAGWWNALRTRIRRFATLHRICGQRLGCSPVPINFSGLSYGQGSGQPYDAVAAEYILAPLTRDSLVRENEPGYGSRTFDLFGVLVPKMGSHPRFFTRWCQVVHPLFSEEPELLDPSEIVTIHPESQTVTPYTITNSIPRNSIPLVKGNVIRFQRVGFVALPDEYRPSGSRNGRDTPGLPVFACIVIPSSLRGPSKVDFYRRGVLMCRGTMELGLPGVDVKVCCDKLKTDFSGMAVVQDETYYELEAILRERTLKLAADTVENFGWRARSLRKVLEECKAASPPTEA